MTILEIPLISWNSLNIKQNFPEIIFIKIFGGRGSTDCSGCSRKTKCPNRFWGGEKQQWYLFRGRRGLLEPNIKVSKP
jgi:hypothetical protein